MGKHFDQAKEFRFIFDCDDSLTQSNLWRQLRLINEEYAELLDAETTCVANGFTNKRQNADLLKEMADLKYVIDQYAAMLGWDIDAAQDLVHENNLTKAGPDGKVHRREDGKILKPDNYKKVDLTHLV
jgi:predicted HAD superfamily Cof-like phosphohydrolase